MSVQATTWAWENSEFGGNPLLVLLAIADAANREGEMSCQSMPTIARMTHSSRATVARCLKVLSDHGYIEKTGVHGRYKTSIYRLPKMGLTVPTEEEVEAVERVATRLTGETSQIETGLTSDTPPVSPVRPNPKELTPEQSTSTSEEAEVPQRPHTAEPQRHPSRAIDNWELSTALADYLATAYPHVNVMASFTRFFNFHFAKQDTSKSWDALFENWVSNDEERALSHLDGGTDDRGIPVTQSGKTVVPPALQPGDEGYFNPLDG